MKNETPVLVLNCGLGGLAIFRSLGALGVECWGVDDDPRCAGFLSRYSRGRRFIATYDAERRIPRASDPGTASRAGRKTIPTFFDASAAFFS